MDSWTVTACHAEYTRCMSWRVALLHACRWRWAESACTVACRAAGRTRGHCARCEGWGEPSAGASEVLLLREEVPLAPCKHRQASDGAAKRTPELLANKQQQAAAAAAQRGALLQCTNGGTSLQHAAEHV